MRKRLQNKIAESRFALLVMALYGIGVWLLAGGYSSEMRLQFALFIVSTFMMVALNNNNALIRIYSRMVSCSFIGMTCAASFLFGSVDASVVQTMFVMFYLSLMRSYQDKHAPGIVFYSFASLGIASLFFVQILYFVPFLWILMATNLMAFSHKMFWASIIGVIAPYWFAAGYYAYIDELPALADHFVQLTQFGQILDYTVLDVHEIATFAVVALLALIGIVHYLRNSYLDKIRTRMMFEMFITVDLLAVLFVLLQPQHFNTLLPVIIVNTSCLYAHFIALTRTRLTNIVFIAVCLLVVALTAYNLFIS